MIFTRGPVQMTDVRVIDQRLWQHGQGNFYSDHAVVLADLTVSA